MERVKVLQSVFVEQNSTQYNEGDQVDVPDHIAKRHIETGFMEISPSEEKQTQKPKKV